MYETPGGTILYSAHDALETITLDRDTLHMKQQLAGRFAELVYYGQWYTPLREALSAFVDKTQENVTGEVKLKLYKGNIILASTTSPNSLYDEAVATFGEDDVYDQKDSAGFINLFGLPITVRARQAQKNAAKMSAKAARPAKSTAAKSTAKKPAAKKPAAKKPAKTTKK